MLSIWEVWVDTSKKTDASLGITQTVNIDRHKHNISSTFAKFFPLGQVFYVI